jgi:hypothetical protein
MRVIVTGSRRWPDPRAVHDALTLLYRDHGPFTLVHGACSTGADAQAQHWYEVTGQQLGCAEDPWPAEWTKHGNRAGPKRNERMVEAGADLVLAFLQSCTDPPCRRPKPHDSHGTAGCIELAEAARIPVRKWKWKWNG